jgi:hypothetical protein
MRLMLMRSAGLGMYHYVMPIENRGIPITI